MLDAVGGGLPGPVPLGRPDRETHISRLWFAETARGPVVLKAKKPVRFAFADLTLPAARAEACRREVALNRRLAPDVYLGVADLREDGRVVDHAVVMRRLPDDRRLATLVQAGGDVRDGVRDVLHRVVALHAAHRLAGTVAAEAGAAPRVRAQWEDNLAEVRSTIGAVDPPAAVAGLEPVVEAIGRLARRYLGGRGALFDRRVTDGWIVDGHGDLLTEDIFLLDDGPRILDCLEFDDTLRIGDALADVAFLAMDLERLGRADLAEFTIRSYRELAHDPAPMSLAHHWVAFRALIRAKVALLRAAQGPGPDTRAGHPDGPGPGPGSVRVDGAALHEVAMTLAVLCRDHLRRAQVHLVLVGGAPGTGKSTLAARLGEARGFVVLRSDEVRKDLAGIAHTVRATAPVGEGIYDAAHTEATYAELARRAERLLGLGESVVIDASFAGAAQRDLLRRVAAATVSLLSELRCEVEPDTALARLERRAREGTDASDATVEVATRMAARFEAWPEAVRLETGGPPGTVLAAALDHIEARVDEVAGA